MNISNRMGQTAQPRADVWEICLDLADETGGRWWAGGGWGAGVLWKEKAMVGFSYAKGLVSKD